MIVSHKHKFIFIKTRKTAGTSVEIALSEFCGEGDIITPISEADEKARVSMGFRGAQNFLVPKEFHSRLEWYCAPVMNSRKRFYNHMPAIQVKKYVGEKIWNSYFKFTIERTPLDKCLSLFHYLGGEDKFGAFDSFIESGNMAGCIDFEKYSKGGVLIVDRVIRYDKLGEELGKVGEKVGLPRPLRLPEYQAKSGYRKKSKREVAPISEETRAQIATAFAREIRLFDFKIQGE